MFFSSVSISGGILLLDTIDFVFPSAIPFTNPKSYFGLAINFFLQTFLEVELITFCFSFISIFLVSVGHLWVEIKLIHRTVKRTHRRGERFGGD